MPCELVEKIVDALDDAALLSITASPTAHNPWHFAACRSARARYGDSAPDVYPHRCLPADAAGARTMWPGLYAEQCQLRASLGELAFKSHDVSIHVELALELTVGLPLFSAHHIAGAGLMLGPWLGTTRAAAQTARAALLLLSLLPRRLRESRLFHMQAAGALTQMGQSCEAVRAYDNALLATACGALPLGLFEAAPVSEGDVVQHMLTCAIVCDDITLWQAAMHKCEGPSCAARTEDELRVIARQLGHTQMQAALGQARLDRVRASLSARHP